MMNQLPQSQQIVGDRKGDSGKRLSNNIIRIEQKFLLSIFWAVKHRLLKKEGRKKDGEGGREGGKGREIEGKRGEEKRREKKRREKP